MDPRRSDAATRDRINHLKAERIAALQAALRGWSEASQARQDNAALLREMAQLRDEMIIIKTEMSALRPFLPPNLRVVTSRTGGGDVKTWCELVQTAEVEEEEEPWDEEAAARAQAEMLATSRARCTASSIRGA